MKIRRSPSILSLLVLCFVANAGRAEDASSVEASPVAAAKDPALARVSLSPLTGLVVETADSRFELHGFAWLRAKTDTRVSGKTNLAASVPLARASMTGILLDSKLHFFVQPEFAGSSVRLLDLSADWRFSPAFQLRVGQFRTPFSRSFITPLTNQELPTRGLMIDHFGLGRDTGVMAMGTSASGLFHYNLALVNGAGINNLSGNRTAPTVVARTELRFGDPVPYDQAPSLALTDPRGLTIGLGGAFSQRAVRGTRETSWNGAADLAWMHGPVSIRSEVFWRTVRNPVRRSQQVANAFGAYTQLGVFVVPRQLEVGGRVGWLTDGPDVQTYEAFVAGYWKTPSYTMGHHLKTIFAYRYDSRDAIGAGGDARDRHVIQIQAQLFF